MYEGGDSLRCSAVTLGMDQKSVDKFSRKYEERTKKTLRRTEVHHELDSQVVTSANDFPLLGLKVLLFSALLWHGSTPVSPYTGSYPGHKPGSTHAIMLCHTHPDYAEEGAQILDGEKHLYGEKSFAAERNSDLESKEELTEVEIEIEPLSSESESESLGSDEDSEVDGDADIEDEEMADDVDNEHDIEEGHSYIEDDEMADDE
ncbi:hypothetical protein ZTR_06586 [Talaromyces verruculosus]|nr:hypothetical protein ZTR_06586 [Talaromyces verruculosus]